MYFEDIPGPGDDGVSNQMRLLTPHQSFNNIHLNIPDLKNYDGNGGRMSSEMMVTSVDQTVTGKKVFRNIEVPNPTSNNQAASKYYVDHNFLNLLTGGAIGGDLDMRGNTIKHLKLDKTESAAARVAELNLKLSLGGGTMTGDINLDNHRVKNSLEPTNSKDLTTKNYVDTEIAKIPQGGGGSSTQFVRRDGTLPMTADLNMDNNKIVNLKKPTNVGDGATKKYVDETVTESSITGSSTENKFAFLDKVSDAAAIRNIVIDSYDDFNDSPHNNKKAFNITLQINVGTNNYNSKMAFNLQTLPIGKYSMIFEFYPPQMTNVSMSCQVAHLILHKQFKREFSNYYKLLIQINNETELAKPIFLTMRGTSTSGLNAHVIVYGVSEWSDYVSPYVYGIISKNDGGDDGSFLKIDGSIAMTGDLDVDTNKIINLKTPTNELDAANKKYIDETLEQSFISV